MNAPHLHRNQQKRARVNRDPKGRSLIALPKVDEDLASHREVSHKGNGRKATNPKAIHPRKDHKGHRTVVKAGQNPNKTKARDAENVPQRNRELHMDCREPILTNSTVVKREPNLQVAFSERSKRSLGVSTAKLAEPLTLRLLQRPFQKSP